MESSYVSLITEMNKKIKSIKNEAMKKVKKEQRLALEQTKRDFAMIGWGRYWRERELSEDGQLERLVESVTDKNLVFGGYDKTLKVGIVDGKAKYRVSGKSCSCPDFVLRGLPCKHMYFLAGILVNRMMEDKDNHS